MRRRDKYKNESKRERPVESKREREREQRQKRAERKSAARVRARAVSRPRTPTSPGIHHAVIWWMKDQTPKAKDAQLHYVTLKGTSILKWRMGERLSASLSGRRVLLLRWAMDGIAWATFGRRGWEAECVFVFVLVCACLLLRMFWVCEIECLFWCLVCVCLLVRMFWVCVI